MATYEIPLTPESQTFNINLSGVKYTMFFYWCDPNNAWGIDISDANGNLILSGLPVIANTDLLEQYSYLNFGGQLIAQTDDNINIAPTYNNLGTLGHVYFITP